MDLIEKDIMSKLSRYTLNEYSYIRDVFEYSFFLKSLTLIIIGSYYLCKDILLYNYNKMKKLHKR